MSRQLIHSKIRYTQYVSRVQVENQLLINVKIIHLKINFLVGVNIKPTIVIIIITIILICLISLESSKPVQMRISVNHEGLSPPSTARS